MKYKIPWTGRAHYYTEEEIEVVVDVMKNATTLTQGEHLYNFERKFSKYIGAKNVFAVNSATSALELVSQICNFSKGDEIIIPSHTYTSSAYPFLKAGANIVWADIDFSTRVVDVETIQNCITDKTKAIVVVHLYGYCANMPEIIELAKKNNLIVIEDVAQAMGTKIENRYAGTFGDFGVYSFHSHKNMTTLGEGGMLVIKDENIANFIPMLRHNGHCQFPFEREYYWKPAMGNVDLPKIHGVEMMPNNFCIGEVECALGTLLLDRIDAINVKKRERALYIIDELKNYSQLKFHRVETDRHNYHLLAAFNETNQSHEFIDYMSKSEGVQCAVQYYPLNRYDMYKKLGLGKSNCPNSDLFFDNMISFPFNHTITDDEIETMINSIKNTITQIFK